MLEVSAWRSLKNDLEAEGQECKGGGGEGGGRDLSPTLHFSRHLFTSESAVFTSLCWLFSNGHNFSK